MPPVIRPATRADVPAIAAIYGESVRGSVATFDTTDPPERSWVEKVAAGDPGDHFLVLEEGGAVTGFAYASAFRPRPAYARTRETSVYLASTAVGRGSGRQVYAELLARVRADGMHSAVAVVALPNPASTALHVSLGFEPVGTFREVGWKLGRWVDTRWYQLLFGDR